MYMYIYICICIYIYKYVYIYIIYTIYVYIHYICTHILISTNLSVYICIVIISFLAMESQETWFVKPIYDAVVTELGASLWLGRVCKIGHGWILIVFGVLNKLVMHMHICIYIYIHIHTHIL